ncbi:hypothetical protein [Promicromonospora sp. NPDC050249]|uniref:hypothetical protein n=1 Tax=Promicromonospora sp. NPDC050249 TaxID=3154743 RepID=UPI0033F0ABAF
MDILSGTFLSPFGYFMVAAGVICMATPVLFLVEQARERSGKRRWGRVFAGGPIPARAVFHGSVVFAAVGYIAVVLGLVGRYGFRDSLGSLLFWPVIVIGVALVWGWVEKEFAWPGWFVAKEVKEVPGEFFERRERGRREKEELIELGREVLRRQAAEDGSAVPGAAASQEPDADRDLDHGPSGNGSDSRNGESDLGSDGRAHRG